MLKQNKNQQNKPNYDEKQEIKQIKQTDPPVSYKMPITIPKTNHLSNLHKQYRLLQKNVNENVTYPGDKKKIEIVDLDLQNLPQYDLGSIEFLKLVQNLSCEYKTVKKGKNLIVFTKKNVTAKHVIKLESNLEVEQIIKCIFTIYFSLKVSTLKNYVIKIDKSLKFRKILYLMNKYNMPLWNKFKHPLHCPILFE